MINHRPKTADGKILGKTQSITGMEKCSSCIPQPRSDLDKIPPVFYIRPEVFFFFFFAIVFWYLLFSLFWWMFTSPFDPHSLMLMKSFWTFFMWTESRSWQQQHRRRVLLLLFSLTQILDVKKKGLDMFCR